MITLVIIIVSIILSGFFSGSETAFFTLNEAKIDALIKKGKSGMKLVKQLKLNPDKLIITILIGNNIVNIGSSSIITYIITNEFGSEGVGIATGIMTFLILTFGEIIPKSIAAKFAVTIAIFSAPIIWSLQLLLFPFTFFFGKLSNIINNLIAKTSKNNLEELFEEELKALAHISHKKGEIEDYELRVIKKIFILNDRNAANAMTNIDDVFFVNGNLTLKELSNIDSLEHFSRIPVYLNNKNNIIGFLLAKDMIHISPDAWTSTQIKDIVRDPIFVNEKDILSKIFSKLKRTSNHIAIVKNKKNEFKGIITIEDIIEEIIGDINDETDPVD